MRPFILLVFLLQFLYSNTLANPFPDELFAPLSEYDSTSILLSENLTGIKGWNDSISYDHGGSLSALRIPINRGNLWLNITYNNYFWSKDYTTFAAYKLNRKSWQFTPFLHLKWESPDKEKSFISSFGIYAESSYNSAQLKGGMSTSYSFDSLRSLLFGASVSQNFIHSQAVTGDYDILYQKENAWDPRITTTLLLGYMREFSILKRDRYQLFITMSSDFYKQKAYPQMSQELFDHGYTINANSYTQCSQDQKKYNLWGKIQLLGPSEKDRTRSFIPQKRDFIPHLFLTKTYVSYNFDRFFNRNNFYTYYYKTGTSQATHSTSKGYGNSIYATVAPEITWYLFYISTQFYWFHLFDTESYHIDYGKAPFSGGIRAKIKERFIFSCQIGKDYSDNTTGSLSIHYFIKNKKKFI